MAKSLDMRKLIHKYNEQKAKMGGAGYIKLQAGENVMRLVCFNNDAGEEELYVTTRTHFIENASYPCLRVNKADFCPICEYVQALRTRKEDTVAQKLSARTRHLFNAVQGGELKILEVGNSIWKDIMKYFADEDYGNIADLETGRAIKIVKEGSGLDTEYSVLVGAKPQSIELPGEPKNLYAMVQTTTEEDLEKALYASYERLEPVEGEEAEHAVTTDDGDEGTGKVNEDAGREETPPSKKDKKKDGKPQKPMTKKEVGDWADQTFGKKEAAKKQPVQAGKSKPKPR